MGGGALTAALEARLVDEFILHQVPVLMGSGRQLLPGAAGPRAAPPGGSRPGTGRDPPPLRGDPMTLDPDVRRHLDGTPLAHLATLLPDGAPHTSPVWIGTHGEHVVFLTSPHSLKARNLRRDPRVALSIAPADDPFEPVIVRGRVVEWLEGDEALADHGPDRGQVHPAALPTRQRARRGPRRAGAPDRRAGGAACACPVSAERDQHPDHHVAPRAVSPGRARSRGTGRPTRGGLSVAPRDNARRRSASRVTVAAGEHDDRGAQVLGAIEVSSPSARGRSTMTRSEPAERSSAAASRRSHLVDRVALPCPSAASAEQLGAVRRVVGLAVDPDEPPP